MSTSDVSPGEALDGLATLIDTVLKDPEARKQFAADPKSTLESVRLPDNVASFFGGLSEEELTLLGRTAETMEAANLTHEAGDRGKVTFL